MKIFKSKFGLVVWILFTVCSVLSSQNKVANSTRLISGMVVDSNKEPLIGVTVIDKNTRIGASTDLNGRFQLKIPVEGALLVFSYVGMETQSVLVKSQQTLHVKMMPSSYQINEVMVVGSYGTIQKKSDLVGSAYQIAADKIKPLPASRIDNILTGLIPGLTVEASSDDPAGRMRYNTRIRGSSSLSGGNEPLWILDGIPLFTGDRTNAITGVQNSVNPLSFIDPNDIESITVLKDAAETTIYGANGANGIILVTTKKAKQSGLNINVNLKYGVGTIDESSKFKLLNGAQYLELAKEGWLNAGVKNTLANFPYQDSPNNLYSATNTDWYNEFFGTGQVAQGGISISSKSEVMSNYFSLNYFTEEPIVKGNKQDRITARLNSTYKLGKRVSLDANLGISYNMNKIFSTGRDYYSNLPIFSPYNEDGSFRLVNKIYTQYDLLKGDINPWTQEVLADQKTIWWPQETAFFNSAAYREENYQKQSAFNSTSRVALNIDLYKGLVLTSEFNAVYNGYYEAIYDAGTNLAGMSWKRNSKQEDPERKLTFTPVGYSRRSHTNVLNWQNTNNLKYSCSIGKSSVFAMAAFELKSSDRYSLSSYGSGFPNDQMQEVTVAETRNGESSSSHTRYMSYFFNGKYSYDNRYFGTFSYRADGNSDFGEYAKWNNFISGGASWIISNEKFFNLPPISQLKLRLSYGSTGNSIISNVISYGSYTSSESNGYNGQLGANISSVANPGLTWEVVNKSNVGLDVGLWKNALQFSFDFYNDQTNNMISQIFVSRVVGESRVYRNIGSMRNRGVEFNLDYDIIRQGDWLLKVNMNAAHNQNKILKLSGDRAVSFGSTGWIEGQDKDTYLLIRWAGVDPRDGAPLWYDKNGNVTRSYSYDNRVPYKSSRPDVSGGCGFTLGWRDLMLSMACTYEIGGYLNSMLARYGVSDGYSILSQNASVEALDRWKKPGDLSPNPIFMNLNPLQTTLYNTRYLYNRSHFRIGNINLVYNLPRNLLKKMSVKSSFIGLTVDNVFIFAYESSREGRNGYKNLMSTSGYPSQRTFSINLGMAF